jgi:hypothetical protein
MSIVPHDHARGVARQVDGVRWAATSKDASGRMSAGVFVQRSLPEGGADGRGESIVADDAGRWRIEGNEGRRQSGRALAHHSGTTR